MFGISPVGSESRVFVENFSKIIESQRQPEFPDVDAMFSKASSFLESNPARISVVGQVKAGKSSLINALSGTKDLLPTEVNPWTAVITNLHFGHPDKPTSGGVFQLFSEDEWQRMLEGDKETRTLAEDLLPGFDTSILKQQVEEMQNNARSRLGALYAHLLGKQHRFSTITPEILERYVSAGHQESQGEADPSANAGRFSGITKSAEVFLDAGPFAVPVTVSDTPGINDPFLVRDEITTSSFRDTDIFIVALSIHQALGAADMALLKMLSRHAGKATIIFVNRIDEVDDPAADVPKVLRSLEAKLDAELDNSGYNLIAGSAHWGHIAVHGSDDEVSAAVNSDIFAPYCKAQGIASDLDDRAQLLAASGLVAVGEALSNRIAAGPVKSAVSKVASEVSTALGLLEALLRERLENEDVALMDVGDIPAILEAEKNRLIDRINGLADLADDMDASEDETRAMLLKNGETVSQSISHTIEATLSRFVDGQAVELGEGFSGGNVRQNWSLDIADLSQRIEEQTITSYFKGRSEMDDMIGKFAAATNGKISAAIASIEIGQMLDNLPHDEIFPGFKPATTLVDIELVNEKGWKFWKKTEMTKEEAISRVQKVIRQEMLPGVKKCSELAGVGIAERTGEALSRISKVKIAARTLIVDEVNALKAEIETLDEGVTKETVTRINEKRAERASARRAQIEDLAKTKKILIRDYLSLASSDQAAGVETVKAGQE